MALQGDDCYFFYYSNCTKGVSCPFRHCEAALGSETICSLWQEGRCYRQQCKFRHMEIQKDRNAIACYWENQPGGCQKPHCAFKHFRPRKEFGTETDPVDSVEVKVASKLLSQRHSVEALEVESTSLPSVPTPKVTPVVVNPFEEESDQESTASTPVKHSQRERLMELVSPAPPTRAVKHKPQPQGRERSGGQSLGIKSLAEIREEKELLARAKKLIEETEGVANLELLEVPPDDLDDVIKVETDPGPGQVTRRIQISAGGDAKENQHEFKRQLGVQPVTSGSEGRRIIVMDDSEKNAAVGIQMRLGAERKGPEVEESRVVTERKSGQQVQSRLGTDRKITTKLEVQSRLGTDRKITTTQEVQSRLGTDRKITTKQEVQSRLGTDRKIATRQEVQSRLGPERVTLGSRLEPEPELPKVIRVAASVNPVGERLQARVSPVKARGTTVAGGLKRLQDRLGSKATSSSSDDGDMAIHKWLGLKRSDADTRGVTGPQKSVLQRLGQSGQNQDQQKSDSGDESRGSLDSLSLDNVQVKSLFQLKREKARQKLLQMKNSSKEEEKEDPMQSSPVQVVRRVHVTGPLIQKEDSNDTDTSQDVEIRIKSLEEIRREKAAKSGSGIQVKSLAQRMKERQQKLRQQSEENKSEDPPSAGETTVTKGKSLAELRKERLQRKLQKQKEEQSAKDASQEDHTKGETSATGSPRRMRRMERQIYKPPSVRQTEQISPPRAPLKEESVKVEERLKPAGTKKGWGVKTFSEIMQEKRAKAQELQQQSAVTVKAKRSFSPIHFDEDKRESTGAKRRKTHRSSPIVFDLDKKAKESGEKAERKRPISPVVFGEVQGEKDTDAENFGVDVKTPEVKVAKTRPAKAPAKADAGIDSDDFVISVSMGDQDRDSVDQDVVSSSDCKQPVAAVPPHRTTPALAARKWSLSQAAGDDDSVSSSDQTVASVDVPDTPVVVSLRRQSSGKSVASQRLINQAETEDTSQQPTVTPGGRRKRSKGSSLSEDRPGTLRQDSFLEQDFEDLLGNVDDDLDQDVTSATHSVSKTEDDLLLEMEELLA